MISTGRSAAGSALRGQQAQAALDAVARARQAAVRQIQNQRNVLSRTRSGPDGEGWTHARSYAGRSPSNLVHKARLARIRSLLRGLDLPAQGLVVDLGCSDGFILSQLRQHGDIPAQWRAAGYEYAPRLVRAGRQRGVPRTRFRRIDLNDPTARVRYRGHLVLCLETLEHVGDYRSALEVIHHSLRPGGWLLLSMPNEVGLVGLVKLLGRPIGRRRAYRDFFTGPTQVLRYALAVATYRDLEPFRSPPRQGWESHLGFDHRPVVRHLQGEFVDSGLWRIERVSRSAFGANLILVVRRLGDQKGRPPGGAAG
jgi:SAM-dependent methyltransferase